MTPSTEPDWNEIRTYLERNLTVSYLKRNPEENKLRDAKKAEVIKWTMEQLKLGPIPGGTQAAPACETWFFGCFYWEVLKVCVRMRDPVCRICGERETKEIHHIRPKHLKGDDHPRNLIGLCFECHDEVHRVIDKGIQDSIFASLAIEPPSPTNGVSLDDFKGAEQ